MGDLGSCEQLVQFFVVADCELDVSWSDLLFLVLICALARQIEDFHGKVLEGCGEEDTATNTDSAGVSALLELSVATSDWEDESGFR